MSFFLFPSSSLYSFLKPTAALNTITLFLLMITFSNWNYWSAIIVCPLSAVSSSPHVRFSPLLLPFLSPSLNLPPRNFTSFFHPFLIKILQFFNQPTMEENMAGKKKTNSTYALSFPTLHCPLTLKYVVLYIYDT